MKIRILTLCASFLIILSIFSGCKITDDQPQLDSLSILGSDVISIEIGEEITVETDAPKGTKLVWTSSSMSAVLTDHGRIMGMKAGKAIITVSYGELADRILVNVIDGDAPIIPDGGEDPGDGALPDDGEKPGEGTEPDDGTTPDDGENPDDTDKPGEDTKLDDGEKPGTDRPATTVAELASGEAWKSYYGSYIPAMSYEEALSRSALGELSGLDTVPDAAPTVSGYLPMQSGKYIHNSKPYYLDENTYVVVNAYGEAVFCVFRGGGYITLEEVAAYVYAFGEIPANYISKKSGKPSSSIWGEHLRVNHSYFSGNTSQYPYEPVLPNISGCGGDLQYYEMDIGTTGTYTGHSTDGKPYNNGSKITRGAARIVYGRDDLDGDGIFEEGEIYLFYTYNHYNDFQEYLNYYGGWGEIFGNITGGGSMSSTSSYNPTPYVETVRAPLGSTGTSAVILFVDTRKYIFASVA